MVRRFVGFALVAVVLGAPVSTAICQATCSAPQRHSCHEQAPPSGTALTAVHPCGHVATLPDGVDQARQQLAAPGVIVPVATVTFTLAESTHPSAIAVDSGRPSFVALTAPLRL
jgi:hypothetical protein